MPCQSFYTIGAALTPDGAAHLFWRSRFALYYVLANHRAASRRPEAQEFPVPFIWPAAGVKRVIRLPAGADLMGSKSGCWKRRFHESPRHLQHPIIKRPLTCLSRNRVGGFQHVSACPGSIQCTREHALPLTGEACPKLSHSPPMHDPTGCQMTIVIKDPSYWNKIAARRRKTDKANKAKAKRRELHNAEMEAYLARRDKPELLKNQRAPRKILLAKSLRI